LNKITYIRESGNVIYKTKYNNYWKSDAKTFTAVEFIEALTSHIPPKGKHLIRYYGLYSSRTKGRSAAEGRFKKFGIKIADNPKVEKANKGEDKTVLNISSNKTWAQLIRMVYEIDPMICPLCNSEMKIIAVITDREETAKIVQHMSKTRASPAFRMPACLSSYR
jgi:hypothetical protein